MRVALYARYSSDLQNERSAEDQLAALRLAAQAKGLAVVAEYADRGISGASLMNRPAVRDLLADAERGRFDRVLCEALDRLSRDQEDTAHVYKRLEFRGVALETLSEGVIGELHVGLSATMNRLFLVELGKKTRRGLEARVRAGFSGGGRCYGYAQGAATGELVVDPAEAEVVRRIYRDYAAGRSPKAIAHALNAEGVKGPRGGTWTASALYGDRRAQDGLLCNELYIGVRVFNRRRFRKHPQTGRRSGVVNPPEQWVRVAAPDLRILDQALWDAAQARKAALSAQPAHCARRPKRLLSGLVRCGVCSGAMTLKGGKLVCSTRAERGPAVCTNGKTIDARTVEGRVIAGVRDRLLAPDAVEAAVRACHAELQAEARATARDRAEIERDLAAADRRLQRATDAYLDGAMDVVAYKAAAEPLRAKKAELEARLAEADAPPVLSVHPQAAAQYRQLVETLTEGLEGDDAAEQREAFRELIDHVVFTPAEGHGRFELMVHSKMGALLFSEGAHSEVMVGAGTRTRRYLASFAA